MSYIYESKKTSVKFNFNNKPVYIESNGLGPLYFKVADWAYNNGFKFPYTSGPLELLSIDEVNNKLKTVPYYKNSNINRDFNNVGNSGNYLIRLSNADKNERAITRILTDFGAKDIKTEGFELRPFRIKRFVDKSTEFDVDDELRVFVVRAGVSNRDSKLFIDENFVAIDYGINFDISNKPKEKIMEFLIQNGAHKSQALQYVQQIELFKEISVGDIVLVPDSEGINVGEVSSEIYYTTGRYPNRLEVEWLDKIEKNTSVNLPRTVFEIKNFDTENYKFSSNEIVPETLEKNTENPMKKMNFIKAAQVCLNYNNNKPMSVNEIWDSIKDYVSYTTETPINSLATTLGFFSENSNRTHKSKTPIFRIVSENPLKYILIDPNNIQQQDSDETDETNYESDEPITRNDAQYLSFWNEFTRRLSEFTKRFDGRKRNRRHWLLTSTDVKSINYICVIKRNAANLELYFTTKSPVYYNFLKLRSQIEEEFGNELEWLDNRQKKCCVIFFKKRFDQNFPENKQQVMNFFLEYFPKFEKVFNKYLKNADNIPEEPTDAKISKFSDWTSSYPDVSPQYNYPNTTTKITSEPQKFTSYLTPIDRFLDPNSQKPETDIERPKIFAVNPFRQAICVFGESGAGKSTTVEKILRKEGHQIVKIMPPASTNGLVVNFEPSKSKYVPGYFGKLLISASENPQKLYTAFFDEMHKTNVIDMINDELLQAISLKRNRGERFVTLDPENSLMFSRSSLLDEESGVIYVPDNVGFIFITSKPKVIANNPDFFNRVDLVKIEGEEDWQRMQTSQDLINNIISAEEKRTFSSIRND